jgi:hypothetical protein
LAFSILVGSRPAKTETRFLNKFPTKQKGNKMKFITKTIFASTLSALLMLTAGRLQASVITNSFTINATALVQSTTNDNGKVTTIAAATKHAVNTKQLLVWLAQDESAEGNYGFPSFPAGAKLVLIVSNDESADFQVWNKSDILLVDVSDILNITHGTNEVVSSKVNDTTGLLDPSAKIWHLIKFSFNDSAILTGGVGVTFDLVGLEERAVTDSNPNKDGIYTETVSATVDASAGEGTYQGEPFVITGSLDFGEKSTLTD